MSDRRTTGGLPSRRLLCLWCSSWPSWLSLSITTSSMRTVGSPRRLRRRLGGRAGTDSWMIFGCSGSVVIAGSPLLASSPFNEAPARVVASSWVGVVHWLRDGVGRPSGGVEGTSAGLWVDRQDDRAELANLAGRPRLFRSKPSAPLVIAARSARPHARPDQEPHLPGDASEASASRQKRTVEVDHQEQIHQEPRAPREVGRR